MWYIKLHILIESVLLIHTYWIGPHREIILRALLIPIEWLLEQAPKTKPHKACGGNHGWNMWCVVPYVVPYVCTTKQSANFTTYISCTYIHLLSMYIWTCIYIKFYLYTYIYRYEYVIYIYMNTNRFLSLSFSLYIHTHTYIRMYIWIYVVYISG